MPTKVSENNKINNFYIITNETKDVNFETTNMIKNYLHKRGKSCWVRPEPPDWPFSAPAAAGRPPPCTAPSAPPACPATPDGTA